MSYEFENEPRVAYGEHPEGGEPQFVRRCSICFRFVKPDETITFTSHGLADEPNATCSKHGRVKMLFEGFI